MELTRIIESEPVFRLLKQALSDQLTIISANRFPMVGKYLPKVTPEYQHAFSNSDFVWLKGQANFQTMPRINFSVFEQKINYKFKGFVNRSIFCLHCDLFFISLASKFK